MKNSERIYNFREVVLEERSFLNASLYAYAIFEPHYGDLHEYLKEKQRLDETEAKQIFKQCVEAVNECHENGIIVRDIKLKKFVFLDAERYAF